MLYVLYTVFYKGVEDRPLSCIVVHKLHAVCYLYYILYSYNKLARENKMSLRKSEGKGSTCTVLCMFIEKNLCMCGCAQFKSTLVKGQLYICQEPVPRQRLLRPWGSRSRVA